MESSPALAQPRLNKLWYLGLAMFLPFCCAVSRSEGKCSTYALASLIFAKLSSSQIHRLTIVSLLCHHGAEFTPPPFRSLSPPVLSLTNE
jgi:hypothetical protein